MKIFIEGLEIFAAHGVLESEKTNPQPFIFDVCMDADLEEAAVCDDVSKTVNYAEACAVIKQTATEKQYDLLESLARECAITLLEKFKKLDSVSVKISKPQAPVEAQFTNMAVEYRAERNIVYLSVGSSLGDRERTIKSALAKLDAMRGIEVKRVTPNIRTAPEGGVAKNEFLNCAAEVECLLSPAALLDKIHTVESHLGRTREMRWDDRTIDIDIIFFGDKVIAQNGLAVPHPLYSRRAFVVEPLKQLCPEKVCPLLHKAVKDM